MCQPPSKRLKVLRTTFLERFDGQQSHFTGTSLTHPSLSLPRSTWPSILVSIKLTTRTYGCAEILGLSTGCDSIEDVRQEVCEKLEKPPGQSTGAYTFQLTLRSARLLQPYNVHYPHDHTYCMSVLLVSTTLTPTDHKLLCIPLSPGTRTRATVPQLQNGYIRVVPATLGRHEISSSYAFCVGVSWGVYSFQVSLGVSCCLNSAPETKAKKKCSRTLPMGTTRKTTPTTVVAQISILCVVHMISSYLISLTTGHRCRGDGL